MTAFNLTSADFKADIMPDKCGDTYHQASIVRGEYTIDVEWTNSRFTYCSFKITKDGYQVWADNECTPPGWEGNSLQAFIDAVNSDFTIEDLYYTDVATATRLAELRWDHMDEDRRPIQR